MYEKILSELGFTSGEIKVYMTLLKLGSSTSGPIIKESKVSKSKVYEILDRLAEKGIINQIKDENVKKFQATNPEKLLEIYDEKQDKLDNTKKELDKVIPQLSSIYESIEEKQDVTIFKGYNGIKSIFNDMVNLLEKDDYLYVFVAVDTPDVFIPFFKEWQKKRIKKGARVKIILNKEMSEEVKNVSLKSRLTEVKMIFPEFNTPAVFNLYKNKSAILLWSKNPIGILIENQEIADSFKKYFDVLWGIAAKI